MHGILLRGEKQKMETLVGSISFLTSKSLLLFFLPNVSCFRMLFQTFDFFIDILFRISFAYVYYCVLRCLYRFWFVPKTVMCLH